MTQNKSDYFSQLNALKKKFNDAKLNDNTPVKDYEEILHIMDNVDSKLPISGDNAYLGLFIIAKYKYDEEDVILGADHDIIYSRDISQLAEREMTVGDCTMLARLNWMVEDGGFACFV